MKILVLSFYYRPDLSAGAFRTTALVDALVDAVPRGSQIDVVTTAPNRYKSFDVQDVSAVCESDGLSVYRIALPSHQSGMIDQSRAFTKFVREAMILVASKDYDLVYATSSRLMTGVLGAWIASKKHARLYLDIRDIFVDTIGDVLPKKTSVVLVPLLSALERWTIGRADRINFVSRGFKNYFEQKYPGRIFSYHTNGIDAEFMPDQNSYGTEGVQEKSDAHLTILYAGNIGEGQGLHTIIPQLAKRFGPRLHFRIYGDGGRKRMLEDQLAKANVSNVELLPPIQRDRLIEAYRDADVMFLHLNDLNAFTKVLPSKIFEYGATGKPVWAGVAGHAAEFIKNEISNSGVFDPCDVDGAIRAFGTLTMRPKPRPEFLERYSRLRICREMAKEIVALADEP